MKWLSKSPRKPKFFIIKFPNGVESLVKCNGWMGVDSYLTYFNEEYDECIFLVAVRWWEAVKFILKGKIFYDDK